MPPRLPFSSDFPSQTVTVTPPPSSAPRLSNILVLLHGLGDTTDPYTVLAKQLNLPETAVLCVRAAAPLPFDLGGFHWGDDVIFDNSGGGLDPDAGFLKSRETIETVLRGLLDKCGFEAREVVVWGVGQGGMVGLLTGLIDFNVGGEEGTGMDPKGKANPGGLVELGGIISLGGALPTGTGLPSGKAKARTPVLVCGGTAESLVPDEKVERVKACYEFVEKTRWRRKGDGMPKNRDEMLPIMRFLARRLRSRAGVPEGSVEVG